MKSRLLAGTGAMIVAGAFAACESLPDIRFVSADGAADGPSDSGVVDVDAAIPDPDTGIPDAADGGVPCTGPEPAGGTCCGTVWCVGMCGAVNCNACAGKGCGAADLCCGKMGTVQCKPTCP